MGGGGGGVGGLLVNPRPAQRLHYPLDMLGNPAGRSTDYPFPILPFMLHIEIPESPTVERGDHSIPQIRWELVGADRPQAFIYGILLPPPPPWEPGRC